MPTDTKQAQLISFRLAWMNNNSAKFDALQQYYKSCKFQSKNLFALVAQATELTKFLGNKLCSTIFLGLFRNQS